jgi:hypothetical protein
MPWKVLAEVDVMNEMQADCLGGGCRFSVCPAREDAFSERQFDATHNCDHDFAP